MIEIKNLTKRFNNLTAVSSLSINFEKGITGLIGENGAGKSTLFRLIADVLIPDEGSIKIDSLSNSDPIAKGNLFFLPDDPYVQYQYNIDQILSFYETFYELDREKCNRLIDDLSLPRNRRVLDFSKGMRRQLFLTIALSVKAHYLLLDEAFDGVDLLTLEIIKQELIKASIDEEKTIIIASHNIESITQLVDRVVLLYKGKLAQEKEAQDMGQNFVKYQILSSLPVVKEAIEKEGFEVISVKNTGSINTIVLVEKEGIEDMLNNFFKPSLLEKIPLDQSELVSMEMLLAKQRSKTL